MEYFVKKIETGTGFVAFHMNETSKMWMYRELPKYLNIHTTSV